jgi:3,4-dihydroxy 2-butanone 4-phosphate synthase/GTP cyclohydrolase II
MENAEAATRRRMLKKWIDDRFNGRQSAFLEDIASRHHEKPLNQGELSSLLKDKSFGEKKARTLESQAEMPPRYLEDENLEISSQMAHLIKLQKEHPDIAAYAISEAIKEVNSIVELLRKSQNDGTNGKQ